MEICGGGVLNHSKNSKDKNLAFSLIELSIVLIIIGLLVAGVTGGASLIESARIRAYINELKGYETALYTFKAAKDRLPGDLNGDGRIGLFSNELYSSSSFPAPYDGSDSYYGVPNYFTAPFVDMYLEKIIEFEPVKTNTTNNGLFYENNSLPKSKIPEAVYYFEVGKQDKNNPSHSKYGMVPGIVLATMPKGDQRIIDPKYYRMTDLKIDDGLYNSGNVRSWCYNGYTGYDAAILNKYKCGWLLYIIDKN